MGLPKPARIGGYVGASVKQETEQATPRRGPKGPPFGTTVDPVEAGRKGGQASALSRRLKPLRELEAGIVESRNGAAKWKLLEARRGELEAVEREFRRADFQLSDVYDHADREREIIAQLKAEQLAILAETVELRARPRRTTVSTPG